MIPTIVVTSIYIAAQMLSDITSLKIVRFAGLTMDAGTLIYPITFTLRDLIHKVAGKQAARTVILLAAIINVFMAGLFWIVSKLPYAPQTGPQPDWNAVLSPVWRIVIASIVAEVFSELTDTEVYHLWVTRVTQRYQWVRVLVSNAVSVPLDSVVFAWGAFGGVYPAAAVWAIVWANVVLKAVVTLVSLPTIYMVPSQKPPS